MWVGQREREGKLKDRGRKKNRPTAHYGGKVRPFLFALMAASYNMLLFIVCHRGDHRQVHWLRDVGPRFRE